MLAGTGRPRIALVLGILLADALGAATFTVTSNADSGPGSLREAVAAVNASAGPHEIHFAIPGSGVHVITLLTDLPPLTETVTVDGYTQPGSSPNTQAPGFGLDTVLRIQLQPGPIPSPNIGLWLQAPDCLVRGIAFNGLNVSVVVGPSADRTRVQGCFVGTDASGMTASTISTGVAVSGSVDCLIGGGTPETRNLISGGREANVLLGSGGSGHRVQGNLIGTDASGLRSLQTDTGPQRGVWIWNATDSLIGGLSAAAGNVISGSRYAVIIGTCPSTTGSTGNQVLRNLMGTDVTGRRSIGIGVSPIVSCANQTTIGLPGAGNVIAGNSNGNGVLVIGTDILIQGNLIGASADGSSPRGHDFAGIAVDGSNIVIGGIGTGEGNLIAYNQFWGISLAETSTGVRIRGNSIHSNQGPGIGLTFPDPAHANDLGDADAGANNLQNFPVLESVSSDGSTTNVDGSLNSAPSTSFDIDFYSNACPPQDGLLEGRTYLGSTAVATNAQGNGTFNAVLPVGLLPGEVVSATATDPGGNTSEFSQPRGLFGLRNFATYGAYGVATGGDPITLYGDFSSPVATVRIGSIPLTDVVQVDATEVNATSPALPAGTANLVEVEDINGRTLTLGRGWISMFQDAPLDAGFGRAIWRLLASEVTAGCAPGFFCMSSPVTRAEMAVFLLRGSRGICYSPPQEIGTVFADVPVGSFAAAWIEALALAGVTAGCGGGNYCPNDPITREQMAVFLVLAFHPLPFAPPPCLLPRFTDVACSSPYAAFIEELAARRVTAGCGPGIYCPGASVTRGEMAVFLNAAYFLAP
jgi:hypothetical protein